MAERAKNDASGSGNSTYLQCTEAAHVTTRSTTDSTKHTTVHDTQGHDTLRHESERNIRGMRHTEPRHLE